MYKILTLQVWSELIDDMFANGRNCWLRLLIVPVYLADKLNGTANGLNLGSINVARESFHKIYQSVIVFPRVFSSLSKLFVTSERIWELFETLDMENRKQGIAVEPLAVVSKPCCERPSDDQDTSEAAAVEQPLLNKAVRTEIEENRLVLKDFTLSTPDRKDLLIRELNLRMESGESLLIVGPSGIGKSSLLRALCGLWDGQSGELSLPETSRMMFLPQNTYIPDLPFETNTLQAQLLFPRLCGAEHSEADYLEAIRKVNLTKLLGKKGIYTKRDWRKDLSNGEKQRLAMARLLLARPVMSFLDEATSALDAQNEKILYSTLKEQGSTFVSVAHKPELLKYHSHVLELASEGRWRICKAKDFSFDAAYSSSEDSDSDSSGSDSSSSSSGESSSESDSDAGRPVVG